MQMGTTIVIGAQWGDEGKGKVVDILAGESDVVVRFQGGNNAGHTLVIDGEKTVLHHIPSGVLQGVPCVLSGGVVVNPKVIWEEIEALKKRGFLPDPNELTIGTECSVIMPYHQALDVARESSSKAKTIGTTGRGIGPCYEDRVGRRSIFARNLYDRDVLERKLKENLHEKNAIAAAFGLPEFNFQEILDYCLQYGELLKPYIRPSSGIVRRLQGEGKRILFEGAQGTLLDIGHGNYPYVTSSNTIAASACVGAGIAPQSVTDVVGIAKAYCTRVGEGPFPTELHDADGELLRSKGHEFGATTGRPRRCGWIDLVALKYAAQVNGFTEIALMKLDVLSGFDQVKIAISYNLPEDDCLSELFTCSILLSKVEPHYEVLPGWKEDLTALTSIDQLPKEAIQFIEFVEKEVGIPITYVSVGPGRSQTLKRTPSH